MSYDNLVDSLRTIDRVLTYSQIGLITGYKKRAAAPAYAKYR